MKIENINIDALIALIKQTALDLKDVIDDNDSKSTEKQDLIRFAHDNICNQVTHILGIYANPNKEYSDMGEELDTKVSDFIYGKISIDDLTGFIQNLYIDLLKIESEELDKRARVILHKRADIGSEKYIGPCYYRRSKMKIEYLDQDDIINIVGTQLDIYDNALNVIKELDVPKNDHTTSFMEAYRDTTAATIGLSISNLFDLSSDDRIALNKSIKVILSDTKLHPVDIKGKVVLIGLKYLQKALYDLQESLSDRGQKVEDAANGLDSKINNLERAVAASIKNN